MNCNMPLEVKINDQTFKVAACDLPSGHKGRHSVTLEWPAGEVGLMLEVKVEVSRG